MKIIVPLLLVAVIAVSGCTGFPDVFGGDVIKVQTRSVEETPKDPIVVKDIHTIPTSPVLPDQEVVLSFVVENRDKIHPVRNIVVDLFNAPGFRPEDAKDSSSPNYGKLCNSNIGVCRPSAESNVPCGNTGKCGIPSLLPGEERLIQYKLLAPSREQIANIRTQARLDFKVLYDFDSSMNFVIPAVNRDEIIRRQRAGQKIDMVFDKSFSSGPVRIDVEPLGVNYLLDNFETILLFNIKNVGSGTILKSEIPAAVTAGQGSSAGAIRISVPDDQACARIGGTCQDLRSSCTGSYYRFLCSGGNDRQCCATVAQKINIPDDTFCTRLGGTCTTAVCDGTSAQFLCPGSNENQCCLPTGTASSTTPAQDACNACLERIGWDLSQCIDECAGGGTFIKGPVPPSKGLQIIFPPELQVTVRQGDVLSEIFGTPTFSAQGSTFTNQKPIQIFRDKSQTSLRFPVKLTGATYDLFKSTQIPFRSYEIKSKVFYTYELRNNVDITINIFENV
ncbi:MAG: hypothetical protein HY514_03930 [Candidatus Aenigmarchaeota archaeon]|nr:hypothetical protein [Candidatus Aenigmarchaeota archaeon]